MKRFLIPISLFIAFIVTYFLKAEIFNDVIWRITDFINFILLPLSIGTLFFKLKQNKESLGLVISILISYLILNILIHSEFLDIHHLKRLLLLNSVKSIIFYFWCFVMLAYLISFFRLIINFNKLSIENYLKNRIFITTIILAFTLYVLDYGFFGAHAGWVGFHGHSFWETSGHLH